MSDRLRNSNPISTVFWIAVFVVFAVVVLHELVRAIDIEAQNQAKYYARPVTVTYDKPAAFRKASPTPDQMESTEALLQIQPLVRER